MEMNDIEWRNPGIVVGAMIGTDEAFQMNSSNRAEPLIRDEIFSDAIYRLLEVDYRVSILPGHLLPVTALLTVMVHKHPESILTKLVLQQVLKGYLGTDWGTEEDDQVEDLDIIAAGSSAELGHFAFPCGDVDLMITYRNLIAVPANPRGVGSANSEFLEMVCEENFPGFVRLRRTDGMMFRHSDLEGRLLRQEPLLSRLRRHGPAWIMPNLMTGLKTYDFVPAIVCAYWPSQAGEWTTRWRRSGWPSRDLVERIVGCGCHVVPIGHRASGCPEYQWRLSFSKAEVMLVQSLSVPQKLVYHILKGIFSELPSLTGGEGMLTSYHLKTLFLWCCEDFPTSYWTRSDIVKNCQRLLNIAKKWLISESWPNYFVRDNNMFERPGTWPVGKLLSLDMLKHSTANVMESLGQDPNLFCREVLQASTICEKWYRKIFLGKSRENVDELAVFVSRLDFLRRDIANYTLYREKEYISKFSAALFGHLFIAVNRRALPSPSFMAGWMQTLRPVSILQVGNDSRYLASTAQIFDGAIGLQYYTVFAKSCHSSTVNWSLHKVAKEHIFRAFSCFDPKRNVIWPTIAASWTYFEFALNPEVDDAELISICDEAIELFKRDDVTCVYERLRGRQMAPPVLFTHSIFVMVDDLMKCIGGYVKLFESVLGGLRCHRWSPGQFRCLDFDEFSPIVITYYVKVGCLLRTYSGRPQERRELIDTMAEWKEVSRVYGSALEQFIFRLVKRQVEMKDGEHPRKSRVY